MHTQVARFRSYDYCLPASRVRVVIQSAKTNSPCFAVPDTKAFDATVAELEKSFRRACPDLYDVLMDDESDAVLAESAELHTRVRDEKESFYFDWPDEHAAHYKRFSLRRPLPVPTCLQDNVWFETLNTRKKEIIFLNVHVHGPSWTGDVSQSIGRVGVEAVKTLPDKKHVAPTTLPKMECLGSTSNDVLNLFSLVLWMCRRRFSFMFLMLWKCRGRLFYIQCRRRPSFSLGMCDSSICFSSDNIT
jgi:hypothetical protein